MCGGGGGGGAHGSYLRSGTGGSGGKEGGGGLRITNCCHQCSRWEGGEWGWGVGGGM